MPQLYGECGFEIHREGNEELLVNRRTRWLGYGAGVLGIPAATAAVVGILGLVEAASVRSDVPAIGLFAMAAAVAVCGLIVAAPLPTYRSRRADRLADKGMRLVFLTWPGERRTAFRTASRQWARTVAGFLRDVLSS